jgi:ribosomal protein S18 acetylase RimI-like enzyme
VGVELVPLQAIDLPAIASRVIPSYAAAKVSAQEWEANTSLQLARADFESRLPRGVSTEGHALFSIQALSDSRRVGELWLEFRSEADQLVCVVLDLFIMPAERRRGYGHAALLAAETVSGAAGASAMRLTVVGDNEAALALYSKVGYQLLNARLGKPLGKG